VSGDRVVLRSSSRSTSNSKSFVRAGALAALAFATILHAGDANAAEDPAALMRKSDKAHRLPYEHTIATMQLQGKDETPRERQVESWTSQDDSSGDKLRVKFHAPAEVKGTGLLSLEAKTGDDEQWLYLPSFKKTRRVGQSELGDRFVGTDFFYEDMKRRQVSDYTYVLLREEKVDGQDCYVIESKPSAPKVVKESPYGKTEVWLRKDNLFAIRIRFFDRNQEPLKQLDATKISAVTKTAWRADATLMVDIKRKHRTLMTVTKRESKATAEDVFSRRLLESE
jgi:hypothetical protein